VSREFDVLLVEDEPVVREAAARILRPEGVTVDHVENVAAALARLRRATHRVVVADLMLPGFSGFDLLERVSGERPELPVILVTGYATIENALAAFKKGAFDFLPKPFDVPELLGVVRRALHAAGQGAWHSLPSAGPARRESRTSGQRHFLGQHAWATLSDGVATIGLAESWPGLIHDIRELRLPSPGDHLTQGLACVEIATGDESIHRVWAPLSGTVLEVNAALREDPDLLNRDPLSSGWLARVAPADLETELNTLTYRGVLAKVTRSNGEEKQSWSS
jgi:CheY-like chemotaxis protein/glycine cleavage system H lipoate-binding protein